MVTQFFKYLLPNCYQCLYKSAQNSKNFQIVTLVTINCLCCVTMKFSSKCHLYFLSYGKKSSSHKTACLALQTDCHLVLNNSSNVLVCYHPVIIMQLVRDKMTLQGSFLDVLLSCKCNKHRLPGKAAVDNHTNAKLEKICL